MADDSDDVIYIDVVPKVDDAAADEAEAKLRDKFKDVAGDFGKDFFDSLGNSGVLEEVGTKLGSVLADPLKDLSETIGVDLKNPLEKLIKQDAAGALDDVMDQLGSKLGSVLKDPLQGVADNLGINLDSALEKALKGNFRDVGNQVMGELGTKLGSVLGDGFKDLTGIDLGGVAEKWRPLVDTINGLKGGDLGGALAGANTLTGGALQPLSDIHDQVKQTVGDTKELAEGFLAGSARGSAAIGPAVEAFGPVAGALASTGIAEDALKNAPGIGPTAKDLLPDGSLSNRLAAPFRMIGGDIMHPSRLWNNARQYDNNGNFIGDGPAEPNHTDMLYQGVFGGGGGSGGGGKTTANEVEVQANDAVISAGSVTLGGSINLPSISIPTSSSGGGGHSASSSSIGSAGSSAGGGGEASLYGGGSGATLGKGHGGFSSGGMIPGDSPGYDNTLGSLHGSPIGLEGGEFIVNPKAAQDNQDLLKALNSGSHFDEGGSIPGGTQQKQIGTGQGAGVSGGLIGAAEQAGVMAAAVGGFGGGGIAAQIAEQEMNLAIQKGSQAAWALASAPLETAWLGGGQMGAPQLQSPLFGWPGKLLGGLIGNQNAIPNLAGAGAGATQPPKQPKPPGQPDEEDPGSKQGKPPAPQGTKDDPMHVNVANQPPGPQPGTATSAMSTMPAMTMAPTP